MNHTQYLETMQHWQAAGLTAASTDDEIGRWVRDNVSSDVLMYMVRGNKFSSGTVSWRVARLAACRHSRGACTGILAERGYPGMHSATLFAFPLVDGRHRE